MRHLYLITTRSCCEVVPVHLFCCCLFLRQSNRISGFCWSLTSVLVWSALIKSKKHRLLLVSLNVSGIDGRFRKGWVHVGRSGSCGALRVPPDPHRPSFASSDFTDLNLMKNSFLITERKQRGVGSKKRQMTYTDRGRIEGGAKQCEGSDNTVTSVTQEGRVRERKPRLPWVWWLLKVPGDLWSDSLGSLPRLQPGSWRESLRGKLPISDRWGDKWLVKFHEQWNTVRKRLPAIECDANTTV